MAQPKVPRNQPRTEAVPRRVIVAVFVASMLFTLGDGSIQLILAPHLQWRGLAPATIGPIVAGYSVAALVFRFVTGAVYRTHLIRYLALGGCLLSAGAFVVISQAGHPGLLAGAVAVNGVGFAITSTGVLAAVMDLRRGCNAGVAMGLYTGCIGSGYALANFLGGAVADALGTASAILVLALLPVAAGGALLLALRPLHRLVGSAADDRAEGRAPRRGMLRHANAYVWLAFFCALHINLLSGVLLTYFPLYGLAIGLTFTQIGLLTGASSSVSSLVRFSSSAVFGRVSYRPFLPWMVVLGSLATAALTFSELFAVLAAAWLALGVSRGVLRVASAALAMDGSRGDDRSNGAASGLYMAGLDIGRIIGPIVGGVAVDRLGYGATFLVAAVATPTVFFAFYTLLRSRERSGRATT